MRRRGVVLILSGLAVGAALLAARAEAVEEPAFRTVVSQGAFEIRDYPARVVAEVVVPGRQNDAASAGFRLLARYIFGGNRRSERIAMTAPVTLRPEGAAVSPASQAAAFGAARTWVVQFNMPKAIGLQALPPPDDPRVRLSVEAPRREAVVRFSGWATSGLTRSKTAELMSLVAARRLRPEGPVSLAQYDPPWTLPFLRRNEVMVRVAA